MRNVSDKSCRENQNTHFVFSNFFPPEYRAVYNTMQKMVETDHIRFVIPVVFNKLTRVHCMYWSNRTLFDGRDISNIYYIR